MSYSTFRNKHNIEVHFTIAMERDSFFFHITSAVDALALRTDSDINIIYYRKAFLLTCTVAHISQLKLQHTEYHTSCTENLVLLMQWLH